jgi:hypothetical protein
MALDASTIEKAKNVQLGLQQFESYHGSVDTTDSEGNKIWICQQCGVDFPCERMLLFMLLQGIASFSAMLPTGNMAAMMNRFMGGKS